VRINPSPIPGSSPDKPNEGILAIPALPFNNRFLDRRGFCDRVLRLPLDGLDPVPSNFPSSRHPGQDISADLRHADDHAGGNRKSTFE